MPGPHTSKEKRMAGHIYESAKKRGYGEEHAQHMAWGTVNKNKKKVKKGPEPALATKLQGVRGEWSRQTGQSAPAPEKPVPAADYSKMPAPAPKTSGPAMPPSAARNPMPAASPQARPVVTMKGKDVKVKKDLPAGEAYAAMGKGVVVMSIDEAYDARCARVGAPARKALSAGYGRTSGGGALKAPNRGYPRSARSEAQRPVGLDVGDLERAVTAMPPPSPTGHQKKPVYLPGVHPPNSPLRAPKKLGPKKSSKHRRGDAGSITKTVTNARAAKVNAEGGATELSASLEAPTLKKPSSVVHKSEGDPTMSKMDFNDLFKSELGAANDDVLIECPHCDHPITKSEVMEKARGHKGKGKVTHQTGAKHGKSGAHVVDQNPEGGTMRGGEGRGTLSPDRGVPGAKKTDAVVGVQNGKGSKASKAVNDDSSSDDASSSKKSGKPSMTMSYSKDAQDERDGAEPVKKGIIIRGTEQVQYIEDNYSSTGDAAIAKAILEGRLGGTPPTQPLDLNNDLTRLLV